MFRDFIYLDIDRVQSILAQLQEGLLTDVIAGKTKEVGGKAGTTAGILSLFLPVSGSVEGKFSSANQQSKILHDHAYSVALRSLEDEHLVVDTTSLVRSSVGSLDSAFVLMKGGARIIDYETLQNLAKNEKTMFRLFGDEIGGAGGRGGQQRNQRQKQHQATHRQSDTMFSQVSDFVDIFLGGVVQVTMVNKQNVKLVGVLNRSHLREDMRSLIFKYGSRPQGDWSMLSQVTRIPDEGPSLDNPAEWSGVFKESGFEGMRSISEAFEAMLDMVNVLQEFVGSVVYPNISVSPIAIYREIASVENGTE